MTTMISKLDKSRIHVYNAARIGDLNEVRRLLEAQEKGDIAEIVTPKTGSASPLLGACFDGHTDVVQYLIDECAADFEQTGTVHARLDKDITPLCCAAKENHLNIVKLLVTRGADVNVTDKEGMTCLMSACRDAHYDLAKYLIDRGADINRREVRGTTALHYCVIYCSLSNSFTGSMMEVMKLLIQCKANMKITADGLTPLLLAADNGQADIVEYLIAIAEIERTQKIDALELLGARYVAKSNMTKARRYWKLAMEERFRDGFHVLPKPVNQQPNASYGNAVEVKSMAELDELISDQDAMQMQALVVRERILGPASRHTVSYIMKRGHEYAARGAFEKCLCLWTYAFDLQLKFFKPLHWQMEYILLRFTDLFSSMMTNEPRNVEFEVIMGVLKRSFIELQRAKSAGLKTELQIRYNSVLIINTLNIVGLMCRIQKRFSEENAYDFKKTIYQLVKLNLKDIRGYTPLHLICEGKGRKTLYVWFSQRRDFMFPFGDVATILIEVGASVNENDNEYGNTPLHVAAKSHMILTDDLITILLDKGADIDACNFVRETPMDVLRRSKTNGRIASSFALQQKYQTLQCLTARVICANDIPYRGIVSKNLQDIVDMH